MYREAVLDLAAGDIDFQQALWIACARDELFFINTFLWVFEPRDAISYPFITWPFQDRDLLLMDRCIGKQDFGMEKSRDMGATWMFLTSFFYRWLTKPRQTFGLVSRNEDAVDKKDDPDTLFWKLDYHWENLPYWMRPERERTKLNLKNLRNQSVFSGYSATADVGRGGRKTAFGMDEPASWGFDAGHGAWASTQHVTNSRIAVGTPKGNAGVWAEIMKNPNSNMMKVSVHWSEHPEKVRGLYDSTDDQLNIIDTTYKFPPDYPFILDGKLRSPWYDAECRRHPIPALIAQELDIDYGGSGFPFFPASAVEQHIKDFGCSPFSTGELDYDLQSHDPSWRKMEGGSLALWIHLTIESQPPHNVDYAIGCDIATGVGGDMSTNSVASVVNRVTGEKVAELCCNDLFPDRFADYVIALRKWFHGPAGDAYVIWESNGPGLQFGKHFMQQSGHRVFYRQSETSVLSQQTRNPGWHSGRNEKRLLLGDYSKAISRGSFINHSIPALDEMTHYIHGANGSIEHDRAKASLDPTSAGENHGDRVIADALAWRGSGVSGTIAGNKQKDLAANPPYNSMAWRLDQHRATQLEESWL